MVSQPFDKFCQTQGSCLNMSELSQTIHVVTRCYTSVLLLNFESSKPLASLLPKEQVLYVWQLNAWEGGETSQTKKHDRSKAVLSAIAIYLP